MSYWEDRFTRTQDKLTQKSVKDTEAQMRKYYASTMEKILGQFEKTYLKVFSRISDDKEPTPADLYKLDSYWQMQAQLRDELNKLGDKQSVLLSKKFEEQFKTIYEAIAIPGEATYSTIDSALAKEMINQVWCADGVSWSQRIWKNTDLLQQELNDELIDCLVAGRKASKLKELLQERFNVSYSRADALVRTEMAHIQTQAAKQRYQDAGITRVKVWASEDERRCEICGKLHEKEYPAGGKMPIPAHPRCRCCIVPIVD